VAPAAVGALFLSHHLRKQRDAEFLKQVRDNCVVALSTWIESAGPQLIEHLRHAIKPIPQGLIARVEGILDFTSLTQKPPTRQEILVLARHCLALAAAGPLCPTVPQELP
jgi:hypothetical protein